MSQLVNGTDYGLSLVCGLLTATGFGTADFIAKLNDE